MTSDKKRSIRADEVTTIQLIRLKSLSLFAFLKFNSIPLTRKNIYYIVDDDTDDQQFLIEALTENDINVQCFTAPNGKEAINNLKKAVIPLPDAIFLDLNMPQLNGKQCLAELKRTASLQHIPVIIYSTTSNKKEMQDTLQMGASYFIVKKSSFKDLRKELSLITSKLNNPDIY
ncbi:MAG TPA: response regulator [Puia sp.]